MGVNTPGTILPKSGCRDAQAGFSLFAVALCFGRNGNGLDIRAALFITGQRHPPLLCSRGDGSGGNPGNGLYSSFTTGMGTDTTAPTVVMVTPDNETTGNGLSAIVVLTFSKSLNPGTINTNNLALLANGSSLVFSLDLELGDRTIPASHADSRPLSC